MDRLTYISDIPNRKGEFTSNRWTSFMLKIVPEKNGNIAFCVDINNSDTVNKNPSYRTYKIHLKNDKIPYIKWNEQPDFSKENSVSMIHVPFHNNQGIASGFTFDTPNLMSSSKYDLMYFNKTNENEKKYFHDDYTLNSTAIMLLAKFVRDNQEYLKNQIIAYSLDPRTAICIELGKIDEYYKTQSAYEPNMNE